MRHCKMLSFILKKMSELSETKNGMSEAGKRMPDLIHPFLSPDVTEQCLEQCSAVHWQWRVVK